MFKRTSTKDVFDQLAEDLERSEDSADLTSAKVDEPQPETEHGEAAGAAPERPEGAETDEHPGKEGTARPRFHRVLRRIGITLIVAVFIAAGALSGSLGWQLTQRDAVATAGQAALDTARNYVVALTTVDTKDIDKNFAEVLNGATGEFKDMYGQSSAQLRQLLIDNKAVSHGTVIDAGLTSATKTKVETLLFVDQSISNVVNPDPRIDRLRIKITMELVDNRWLASHVEIL